MFKQIKQPMGYEPGRAQPDITSGSGCPGIFKCPDSGLPVFFLPGLRTFYPRETLEKVFCAPPKKSKHQEKKGIKAYIKAKVILLASRACCKI